MYARLGDVTDPLDDDYNADGATDGASAYADWVATVKAFGGTVTAYPADDGTYTPAFTATGYFGSAPRKGLPAAKYPFGVVYDESFNLKSYFHRDPDVFSSDKRYAYYLAPSAVLDWWLNGGKQQVTTYNPSKDPVPPNPNWYDSILTALKWGGVIVGGLVVLEAASLLPHSRG